MKTFHYIGINRHNKSLSSTIEASSRSEAAAKLLQLGISPVHIEAARAVNKNIIRFKALRGAGVTNDELALSISQLVTLTRANVTIIDALKTIHQMTKNKQLKSLFAQVILNLESGLSLADAFMPLEELCGRFGLMLLAMGEKTGQIAAALEQLKTYLEQNNAMHQQLWQSFRYPLLVISFCFIAIAVVNVYVIPLFENFFNYYQASLPWATKMLLASSALLTDYWGYGVILLFAMGILWHLWLKTETGRYQLGALLFKLPLVGLLYQQQMLIRFTEQLCFALRANVPLLQAIQVLTAITNNQYIVANIEAIQLKIEQGNAFSQAIADSPLFPPLVRQVISVGERSGQLANSLDELAQYYIKDFTYRLKCLNARLEPILITVVAVLVMILALGVFMPMWDISTVINQS